eukprot:CAMPEP_0182799894 /NCGR_PEP_ID=MMETSP0006_2-20121128/2122_1 /TAXON_ID=97485 /ORGANISM="Prymnesium parvum, Strain Texoma1" /LENGTH=78 /DNA_ID=CAMNT_0024925099 /DNA_START=727 /DNA_END=959 /DNA_ORIENTATION=+
MSGEPAGEHQRARPHAPASAAVAVWTLEDVHLNYRRVLCHAQPEGACDRASRLCIHRVEPAVRIASTPQEERRGGGGL